MNTTAHVIFGAAAFARPNAFPDSRGVTAAAVGGALLPDLSVYFMVGWQSWAEGRSPEQVFGYDYRDPFWQGVFAVDNSIVLWGALLAVSLALARPVMAVFAGSGLMHVCFDFLLHHNDARRHFWPLSDWVFVSPVSYWDPDYYGGIAGPLELIACIALGYVLWRRFKGGFARALVVLSVSLEAVPALIFPLLFASH
jgi:hypothetical protein